MLVQYDEFRLPKESNMPDNFEEGEEGEGGQMGDDY